MRLVRARHDRAGDGRGADQRAGLARVHRAQRRRGRAASPRRRRGLADRSPGRRPCRQRPPRPRRCAITRSLRRPSSAGFVACRRRLAREQRERFGQQPVAGEDRHRLRRTRRATSAVRAAACRCPSPAGRRGSASRCGSARSRTRPAARAAGILRRQSDAGAARLRPRRDEHRPQPLAAGEEAVAHRLVQAGRDAAAGPKMPIERPLDTLASRREPGIERLRGGAHRDPVSPGSRPSDAGAGLTSPRSLRISMRRSASSSLAWQKRESCTPRSNSSSDARARGRPPRAS